MRFTAGYILICLTLLVIAQWPLRFHPDQVIDAVMIAAFGVGFVVWGLATQNKPVKTTLYDGSQTSYDYSPVRILLGVICLLTSLIPLFIDLPSFD